ncbi:MAG: Maf family protein [Acidobacteriota bacterium]|nr:Maf family protein [Acidobacteriota bacterium]
MPPLIVLASSSPRRKEVLASLGLRFETRAADIDESLLPLENAFDAAERLARAKAERVAAGSFDALVVAADTLVVLEGVALGKPRDRADARRMLSALAGRPHDVVTGVACARGGRVVSGRETTRVVFAPMSQVEIETYAASGEPDDKAGAYGLQGIGGIFVERVEGSPSNVVGLPVRLFYRLASELGVDLARGAET